MWYAGLVLSTAGLGGSTAGSCVQGERRVSIYCPGLEGSNAGSRAQGHHSHTVPYGRIRQRVHRHIYSRNSRRFIRIYFKSKRLCGKKEM